MNALEFLTLLSLIGWGWGALVLTRLHDARNERDLYRADASANRQIADSRWHKADRLGQELIAAHVALDAANKHAADMQAQRDVMQRRLAAATWPIKGDVNA